MLIRVIITLCALLVCSWWAIDGTHAVVKGDLVTPKSGSYAGQYGPWSKIVSLVGIDPHARSMHIAFLVMGVIGCAVSLAWMFLGRGEHAQIWWWGMMALGAFQLWYLPFGTLFGLVQLTLLTIFRHKLSSA
ncbi:MAG: hypothetical protein H6815_05160 [Phycisphaeraceae bacterium]|nr:hypothetical protein [Phycisphaerales bacterium]MCB9859825.1 hypothetical protein [Phycisphaeraceae bacterium]